MSDKLTPDGQGGFYAPPGGGGGVGGGFVLLLFLLVFVVVATTYVFFGDEVTARAMVVCYFPATLVVGAMLIRWERGRKKG